MLGAFGVITAMLVSLQLLEYLEGKETEHGIALIQHDPLRSTRLISQLASDFARGRVLVDRHIFEHDAVDMDAIESELSEVRADYDRTAREYSPLATSPGEPYAWHRLGSDVATARQKIDPVLALSRENHDVEAARLLVALDPLFEQIDRDITELLDINQSEAVAIVADVRAIQSDGMRVRLIVQLAMLAIIGVGGLWLTRRISHAQQDLAVANDELARRNAELDAFAGRVAHDLRGPLGSITLATDLLVGRVPDAGPTAKLISGSATQIANLIDDLLALSRASGSPRTTCATEPVAAALQQDLGRVFAQAGGTLNLKLDAARVTCSEGLLRQALWNLGENAVKYRRPDVPVELELEGHVEGGHYTIHASDNGLGMSEDDARRAFEPFFRSPQSAAIPGTGLGLAIVRRVVEACGGRISVESELGHGTTFAITLPLAA